MSTSTRTTFSDRRWAGVTRPYQAADVEKLRGKVLVEHTLARRGAENLWKMMSEKDGWVAALGAVTGNQAMQQVRAGLRAVYCSGWQTAADANVAGQMYPDQSLYPANSVPELVRRINPTPCAARTRSSTAKGPPTGTGLCPLWPTRRQASVAPSMRLNS